MNFSKRSYHFAVFSIILMIAFLVLSLSNRNGNTSLDDLVGYMITLFFVTVTLGFICAMISIREAASYQKFAGMVVNVILMILLTVNTFQNLSAVAEVFS